MKEEGREDRKSHWRKAIHIPISICSQGSVGVVTQDPLLSIS